LNKQALKDIIALGEGYTAEFKRSGTTGGLGREILLNLSCYLLDRQDQRLANDFENEGGFTERLYRVRNAKRRNKS
jgi:four helix bundle suffix protein